MLTRDGRRVVTSFEGATVIRDARTLRPLRSLPVGAQTAALSPDDRTVLLGGSDGSVRFLDLVTGQVRPASGRHEGAVVKAAFNADGASAITAGQDDRVIVWDVEHAEAGETLAGHSGQVTGLAISHDNQTLYSAALDGKVLIWDLAGTRRLGRPFDLGPGGPTLRYALSPDGRVLAAGHADGTVSLIDARTLTPLSAPLPRAPRRAGRGHGVRPAQPAARRRRRHGPRHPGRQRPPAGDLAPSRRPRPGHDARLQRRRTPHGHGERRLQRRARTASCACGRCPQATRSVAHCSTPWSPTCRSAPTGARWPSPRDDRRHDKGASRSSTRPRTGAAPRSRRPKP